MSQAERAKLWEKILWIKLHQYNQNHPCAKLNRYTDNGEISFKV
jgi:hypothetical protein